MQPTDLRTRLQQRRDRIAAGQPIPDTVTMTERFFEESMLRRSRRCERCGEDFAPRGKEVICETCKKGRSA